MGLSFQDKIKPIGELEKTAGGLSFTDKIQAVGEEPGFVQSIAQSLASPFLRFGANVAGIAQGVYGLGKAGVQALSGDQEGAEKTLTETEAVTQPGREFDFGYLGKVKTIEKPLEAVGVGLEIGANLLPVGEAPALAKAALAGKIAQGAKIGAKVGAVSGGLTGAGQALQAEKSLGETFFDTAVGAGFGTIGGTILGGITPVAGKIYQKFAQPYEERIVNSVKKYFPKAIKPSTAGKVDAKAIQRYEDSATKAITLIANNKDKLVMGEKVGVLPETVSELTDSITQAKREVFKIYNEFTKQTGEAGQKVSLSPIADELDAIANDIGLQDNFPQIAIYAEQKAQKLRARQFYDPETAEKVIAEYNSALKSFYTNPSYEAATKVRIDALAVNRLRQSLDDLIEKTTGAQYQEIKSYYGALKAIEKDVARAAIRTANKNVKGIIDFSDILSAGDVLSGIITLDPTFFAKGIIQKGVAAWYKQLNSPDALIKKMFLEVEENINKIKTGKIPPILKAKEILKSEKGSARLDLGLSGKSESTIQKELQNIEKKLRSSDNLTGAEKDVLNHRKGELMNALKQAPVAPKAENHLTTKFLSYIDEKLAKDPNATLSKQEITDFARRPELKKGEAELLTRKAAEIEEAKIPAQEFADSLRSDLLELKPVKVKEPQHGSLSIEGQNAGDFPDIGRRGPNIYGKNYEEVVFESPIETNGSSHFPNSKNYFAHTRGDEVVEGGKKIWREQEIQSDLVQKGNLENLKSQRGNFNAGMIRRFEKEGMTPNQARIEASRLMERGAFEQRISDLEKLEPFTNDRFGERIMRERIKEKALKGYEKYRLPTGETIGKIEGFTEEGWTMNNQYPAVPADLKVGEEIFQTQGDMGAASEDGWIITDILGDGRFKAVTKEKMTVYEPGGKKVILAPEDALDNWKETFDLTGKSNPQYRRYSDWGKFLKNKYGGREVTDPQGNTWIEIDLNKKMGKLPIEAFALAPLAIPSADQDTRND